MEIKIFQIYERVNSLRWTLNDILSSKANLNLVYTRTLEPISDIPSVIRFHKK